MTCIVGVVEGDTVYLGTDTQITSGYVTYSLVGESKLFSSNGFLYGGTGSFRGLQIAQHCFIPPNREDKNLTAYMALDFAKAFRESFEGNSPKDQKADTSFLIAHEGALFCLSSDYAVFSNPYMAIGSGSEIALGSLFSTDNQPPAARILTALKAAAQYNSGVSGPFTIRTLKKGSPDSTVLLDSGLELPQ